MHRPEPALSATTATTRGATGSRPSQLLAMQRSAGNRAVGRLVGGGRRRLDRCGCGGRGGDSCGCAAGHDPADDEARRISAAGATALRRAVATRNAAAAHEVTAPETAASAQRTPIRGLQRVPAYRPNPSWSVAGRDNPAPTCTPFFGAFGQSPEATAKWQLYASVLPGQITARCGCSLVGDAYAKYLSATGGTTTMPDNGNCISEQLASEDSSHTAVEAARLTAWARVEDDFIRRSLPAGTTDVELDLLEAGEAGNLVVAGSQPARRLQVDSITYTHNTLAGGLLFGGGHDPGDPPDSECGNDSRVMTASVQLHRTDDGSDPTRMAVTETFTFRYALHDGFDFCPGNTIQMPINLSEPAEVIQQRLEYNQLLTDLSRLEASGMARDVCFDVQYHRTRPPVAHTVGIPSTGPVLAPSGVVTADVLHIRGGPGTGFPSVGRAANGRTLTFDCFSHGESIRGDDAWCRIAGGNTWVSHSFIADTGSGRLPECP